MRRIRTAGKGSGSIELTLPADLRDLVGLPCRISLRDGSRPDIVLQPDLRPAHQTFVRCWQEMATVLLPDHITSPPMPLSAFGFALQPRAASGDMPFLCWRDGLALSADAPHDPLAVSRTISALGHAMATLLGIDPALAAGFGATSGYLVAAVPATSDMQEACDLAKAALRVASRGPRGAGAKPPDQVAAAKACANGVRGPQFWSYATPLLNAAVDLFLSWSSDPASHAALRAAWRRGRAIEMSGD